MPHLAALIANVGNHDVRLKEQIEINGEIVEGFLRGQDEDPNPRKSRYYEYSKYIYEHYEDYKNVIEFPILEPLLSYLKNKKEALLSKIIIFTTKQEPTFSKDTYYVAMLFQKHVENIINNMKNNPQLKREWGKFYEQLAGKKPAVVTISSNPSSMDTMFHFYSQELARIHTKDKGMTEIFYYSLTGGTPAMNNMMFMHGLKQFSNKAKFIYLPHGSKNPDTLDIGNILLKEEYVKNLRESIEIYEYYSAIEYLEHKKEEFDNPRITRSLLQLLRYAHYRQSFDFQSAIDAVDGFSPGNTNAHIREGVRRLSDEIEEIVENLKEKKMQKKEIMNAMKELYWNAFMLYKKGQFIDFCGRLFRFQEESLKQLLYRLPVETKEDGRKLDETWLQSNPDLMRFLQNYKKKKEIIPIDVSADFTRLATTAIIEFYIQKGETAFKPILDKIKLFDSLSSKRNYSIMAHGFSSVSKEDIFNAFKKNGLPMSSIDDLESALSSVMREIICFIFPEVTEDDFSSEKNVYHKINQPMFELLKQLCD